MADKPISWRVREALDLGLPCVATLRPGTKLLLSFLASCADPDGGGIKRSVSTLSRITGLKTRTLKYRLEELRRAGVLVYESPGGGRAPAVRRIVLSGAPPCTAGVQDVAPQQCKPVHRRGATSGTAAVQPAAPKVNHEGDLEGDREELVVVDGGGWPASPAMDATPRGPNAPPTPRQVAALAGYADELGKPTPAARTKGEASRLLNALRAEAERQRAASRERARREGKRDAYEEQRKADEQASIAGLSGGE